MNIWMPTAFKLVKVILDVHFLSGFDSLVYALIDHVDATKANIVYCMSG